MSCIYSHEDGAYCDKHSHGAVTLSCYGEEDCPDRIVKTKADSLPLMPIDELAKLCASPCPPDQACGRNTVAPPPNCVECWRRWLESEVDDG